MKILRLLSCALVVLALASVAEGQVPRVERPTWQVGDRWLRSDGAWDLVRIENGHYVLSNGPGGELHFTKNLALVKAQRGQRGFAMDPPVDLQWPLKVGYVASSDVRWITGGCPSNCQRRVTVSVDKYEEVKVPAGTFKAFRISMESAPPSLSRGLSSNHPGNWTASITLWYAPDIGRYVKFEADRDFGGRGSPGGTAVLLDVERPAPLAIVVGGLSPETRTEQATLPFSGTVTADKGVRSVAVTLNGVEILKHDGGPQPQKQVPLTTSLPLRPGRNVVLVTATDVGGEMRQEARAILYEPRGGHATGPPPGHPRPRPPVAIAPEAARPEPRALPKSEPTVVAKPEAPQAVAAATPPPFEVKISSPSDRVRVDQESVALAGIVSGGRGVSRVTVTVNGVEVVRQEEKTPLRAVPLNLPLKLREGQNTLVVTAIDGDGVVQQDVRAVEYARPSPLAIGVRFPEDRARLNEESTLVVAAITSGKGVAKVSVQLNGVEVAQQTEKTPQTSLVLTAPVTLRTGTNAIVISATDAAGGTQKDVRTVTYDPPVPLAAVPPAAKAAPPAPKRNQWAVVIGVGSYEHPGIPRLKYTVPDAEAIYQTLIGPGGFKKEHVLLLTDRSDKKPTLRNIKWALGTFLGRSALKDDTVVIFYAGHGAPEVDTRGLERDGLAKYLIPSDADLDDLYSTALPMDELQTIFGRIEAERVVAFLDACYSGAVSAPGLGRTFASKKTRAGAVDDLFLERITRSKGRAIVTASAPAEVSIELPELGHGIFTYYLVNGLKGAADANRDGIVSFQELYEYVEQQVTMKSRAVGGNQHPVMKGELEGTLPLVKVGK